MKSAFLLLAGGILFTGVFLGGMIAGGAAVYAMEHDEKYKEKKKAEQAKIVRYSDISEETTE